MFLDVRDHQDRLLADPDFDPSFDQLIDTTPAGEFNISAEQAISLAGRRIVSPKSRRAFVAVKPHIFDLGRMMEISRGSMVRRRGGVLLHGRSAEVAGKALNGPAVGSGLEVGFASTLGIYSDIKHH